MLPFCCRHYHEALRSCDLHAALLGLVNELIGGSLIAPSGQELQPTAAALQWADVTGSQDISSHAWSSVGVAVSREVCCHALSCVCTGVDACSWLLGLHVHLSPCALASQQSFSAFASASQRSEPGSRAVLCLWSCPAEIGLI